MYFWKLLNLSFCANGSDITLVILNSSMNVPHIAHWGWASGSMGNSKENSETLPISWTDLSPKLADQLLHSFGSFAKLSHYNVCE